VSWPRPSTPSFVYAVRPRNVTCGLEARGTEIPDLNSAMLSSVLCDPTRVPAGFTDPSAGQTLSGTLTLLGRFAVAQQWSPGNLNLDTYLERCGSRLHRAIDPNGWPLAANSRLVVWVTAGASGLARRSVSSQSPPRQAGAARKTHSAQLRRCRAPWRMAALGIALSLIVLSCTVRAAEAVARQTGAAASRPVRRSRL
jgi:hypothetical protein